MIRKAGNKMKGFCEKKFSSMLIAGTFTKAVMYLMLLSDSIIAGYFVGASGVAGINAITPVTAIVTFFGDLYRRVLELLLPGKSGQ